MAHTVEVTAESLYEAVAQGLAALRGREWVAGLRQGTIKVSVADVRVEARSQNDRIYEVARPSMRFAA